MVEHAGFRYRLYPTPEHERSLERWAGCARAVWNAGLEQRRAAWRMNRVTLIYPHQGGNELTEAKSELAWLREPHSDVLQQTLRDLDRAFQNWWVGRGRRPRFRRRGQGDRLRIESRPGKGEIAVRRLSRRWAEVRVPKLGWTRFRWTRKPEGTIKHLTISRDALGWHVAMCCERDVAAPPSHAGAPVGIDRGVAATVALSTGELHRCPDLPPGQKRRLRRLRRRAGRQETARRRAGRKTSNRQRRVRRQIAKLLARQARIRSDFLHQLSTDVAKSHGLVVIEDLNVAALTRSARGTRELPGRNVANKAGLNQAILAQGWGELRRQLAYKTARAGGELRAVPAAHTSQTCAACSAVDGAARTGRLFRCTACGHAADADVNAAQNILAAGLGRDSAGSRLLRHGEEPRTTRTEVGLAA